MPALMVSWLLSLSGSALAQSTEIPDTATEPTIDGAASEERTDITPPPLVREALYYAKGWMWTEVSPVRARVRGFVAIETDPWQANRGLAVDSSGGIWHTVDGGSSWAPALPGLPVAALDDGRPDDEDLLLEAEATAEDTLGDSQTDDEEVEVDDGAETETVTVSTDQDTVGSASDSDLFLDELREGRGDARTSAGLWFSPQREGFALVSRADGLWASNNGGVSFRRIAELADASDFAQSEGLLLAATGAGVQFSLDWGQSWIRVGGEMEDLRVRDLNYDEAKGLWYAATERGLFVAADGESWLRYSAGPHGSADFRAVLLDQNMDGGLWAATHNQILRSDDGGRSFFALARYPLPETTALISTFEPGHLLLTGADGVWESQDGSVTWRPMPDGLPGPDVHDIAFVGGRPMVASSDGLFRLVEAREAQPSVDSDPFGYLVPDLDTVLGMALTRPGMDARADGLSARLTVIQRVAPDLRLRAYYFLDTDESADFLEAQNSGGTDDRWFVQAQLCWGGCTDVDTLNAALAGTDFLGGDATAVGDILDEPSAFVLGDEIYGAGDLVIAGATTAERATKYRSLVIQEIIDLYSTREQLLNERARLPPDDLRLRVFHELKILEATARLDGYTDNTFSSERMDESGETQ